MIRFRTSEGKGVIVRPEVLHTLTELEDGRWAVFSSTGIAYVVTQKTALRIARLIRQASLGDGDAWKGWR